MKTASCRGCGKPIVWATNEATGQPIPLDPSPPVYLVAEHGGQLNASQTDKAKPMRYMVSHFITCSKANDFSGTHKKRDLTTDIHDQEERAGQSPV